MTADHGESLGEHGEPTHSYGVYDATQRVPLLVAGPGVPPGAVRDGRRRARRRGADAARARGAAATARGERDEPRGGAPRRAARVTRRAAWVETLATQLDMGWSPLLGVRTAQHKYVRAPEPELYDLAADPRELTNRAAALPELAAELDRLVGTDRRRRPPVVPSFRPDAEERAQLEALGYLKGAREPSAPSRSLGQVGGPDRSASVAERPKVDRGSDAADRASGAVRRRSRLRRDRSARLPR